MRDLKRFLKQFPAWTNVLLKPYQSDNSVPTSARSENHFREIKETILHNHQPRRADKFLVEHIRFIKSKSIEARALFDQLVMQQKNKNRKPPPKPIGKNKPINHDVLKLIENWKNQVKPELAIDAYVEESCEGSIDHSMKNYSTLEIMEEHSYALKHPTDEKCPTDNNQTVMKPWKILDKSKVRMDEILLQPLISQKNY